ncbi:SCF ubiquitin ligase complex subunit cdc4 [Rhodosporidiobolus nylandii]
MDVEQAQLGLTAPMAREVETVTTRTETRTTHAPRRASYLPSTLDSPGAVAPRDSADDYALLHLAPAVTTTVVTTTTETKTTFAPIRIPKTRSIRPAYSSFSADQAGGSASSSTSALPLDPKMYPLSQAQWPGNMKRFNLELGGMSATFYEDAAEVPPAVAGQQEQARVSAARFAPDVKGKGKAVDHDGMAAVLGPAQLSRAERGALHQRRLSRRARGSLASAGSDGMEEDEDAFDERDLSDPSRLSPGPPRKRPRAESASLDRLASADSHVDAAAVARATNSARRLSQAHVLPFGAATVPQNPPSGATTLPSPNQSPPSPVPTFGGEDSQELKDDDEREHGQLEQINPQAFDFGSGAAISGLLSLPDLVGTFDQLPSSLQSYLIFQLLRRSSIPVLQSINQIIEPSLRRDFLADLPPELGVHVLCYLDAKTLCRASLVSKRWRGLIDGEWRVWKEQLQRENLWIGDGSEEREAREIATGSTENLFLKRWKAGVWDQQRPCQWNGKVDYENLYVSGVGGDSHRPSISHRLASPSSSRETSPYPPAQSVHPFKHLYRRRWLTRQNWKYGVPKRTTFPSALRPPTAGAAAANPLNNHVVTCLQFDKDKVVSASDDHSINIFETQTGALRASLVGHEGGVWALQYVGNVLVSGSTDRTVRIWDLQTGRCTHTFIGHTSTVRCLQIVEPQNINPDPRGAPIWEPPYPLIVTGSRDWSLRVWKLPMPGRDPEYHPVVPQSPTEDNTAPDDNPYHLRHLGGHHHAVRALAAHGSTLVSGSYDMDVRVWDTMSGKLRHRLQGHTQKVYSVVYDHIREQCASGSMDGTVRLWSTATGECRRVLEGHTSLVGLLGLSHRNLVSAAADWTLRIWDPESGECKHSLSAHQGAITCFQHDEHKVISGSDGTLKMWDVNTGELVRDLLSNLTGVWQVSFDQRFCIAAVSRNNVSEFEILDFGAVDPDPPVPAYERYPSPSPAVKREDDDDYGYSSTIAASGSGGAAADDVTMADFAAQAETPLASVSTPSLAYPLAPRLGAAGGFTTLPSAASSATSLHASTTPTAGPSGSSSRTVRRTNESHDLLAQARAQAGTSRMVVEQADDNELAHVKAEEE